jgi:hypothetical protein
MKKSLMLGIAALGLAVALPAMAADMYAVSKLTTAPQTMTDRQLNRVEGAAACFICAFTQDNYSRIYQRNTATQANVAGANGGNQANLAGQGNVALVGQSNR